MSTPDLPLSCPGAPSRRETRREERRDTILEVATRMFLDQGYAGTTMSGIAASLGGSKGTLWSYYSSKESLFGDVLDRATREFREWISLALNSDEPVEAALLQACRTLMARITNPGGIALHRLVVGEAGRFPEIGRIFHKRVILQLRTLLARFIEEAMASGKLRHDDPDDAADVLTGLCMAGAHQQLLMGVIEALPVDQVDTLARRAVDRFLRIYRPEALRTDG